MSEIKPASFIVACKEYFGFHPEQSLQEFQAEVKQLTAEDRAEMAPMLAAQIGRPVNA